MDVILIKALQLILAFAILVIIHEFGHFLFARIFGIKVERFYIFFNPWFSLFKWKPKEYVKGFSKNTPFDSELENAKEETRKADSVEVVDAEEVDDSPKAVPVPKMPERKKDNENEDTEGKKTKKKKNKFWGDTEYGIGWLPLGGYCKIAGMIDESMDTEQMKKPAQPWEFRSKPAWQRLLVMIAGVLFNFLLAILIYAGIVYTTGEEYVTFKEAKAGMHYSEEAKKVGFQDGDIPLMADGKVLENPYKDRIKMIEAKKVTVLRNGKDTVNIAIPEDMLFRLDRENKANKEKNTLAAFTFLNYRMPVQIAQVQPGEGAAKAGIQAGDRIIALDSVPTPYLIEFYNTLEGHANQTINATVVRNIKNNAGDTLNIPVTLNAGSKLGVMLQTDPSAFYNAEKKEYGLFESIPRGVELGTGQLTDYVGQMKYLFTKEGAQSVGGFGAIGSIFPESWDWIAFWNIAAFLSVALAFMNILPIPGLDGGHVLFLIYEVIFRRPPNQRFQEIATTIGIFLLIALLLYANGMDIVRLFK